MLMNTKEQEVKNDPDYEPSIFKCLQPGYEWLYCVQWHLSGPRLGSFSSGVKTVPAKNACEAMGKIFTSLTDEEIKNMSHIECGIISPASYQSIKAMDSTYVSNTTSGEIS